MTKNLSSLQVLTRKNRPCHSHASGNPVQPNPITMPDSAKYDEYATCLDSHPRGNDNTATACSYTCFFSLILIILLFLNNSATAQIDAANEALEQGNYPAAAEANRKDPTENPDDYKAVYGLARAEAYAGNYAVALQLLEKLIEQHPEDADCRLLRGMIYAWQKRFEEAEIDLLFVTGSHPEYVDAWSALGNLYLWWGNSTEAVAAFSKLIELGPDDPAPYLGRAVAQINGRLFAGARSDLQIARSKGWDEIQIDRLLNLIARAPAATDFEVSILTEYTSLSLDYPDWCWHETNVKRELASGSVAFGFVHAERWEQWDSGIYLDAYRDLWRRAYGNLRIQSSQGKTLPRMDYLLEVYQGVEPGWEFSGGYRLMQFSDSDESIYILSAAKYIGSFYLRARSQLNPSDGELNHTHLGTARWYYQTIDDYAELTGGYARFTEAAPGGGSQLYGRFIVEATAQKFIWQRIGLRLNGYHRETRDGVIERGFGVKVIFRF